MGSFFLNDFFSYAGMASHLAEEASHFPLTCFSRSKNYVLHLCIQREFYFL